MKSRYDIQLIRFLWAARATINSRLKDSANEPNADETGTVESSTRPM